MWAAWQLKKSTVDRKVALSLAPEVTLSQGRPTVVIMGNAFSGEDEVGCCNHRSQKLMFVSGEVEQESVGDEFDGVVKVSADHIFHPQVT